MIDTTLMVYAYDDALGGEVTKGTYCVLDNPNAISYWLRIKPWWIRILRK